MRLLNRGYSTRARMALCAAALGTAVCVSSATAQAPPCRSVMGCLLVHQGGRNAVAAFVSLHADEQTALRAFRAVPTDSTKVGLHTFGTSSQRLASTDAGGRPIRFDPNRIFTPDGARATLERYNEGAPAAAVTHLLGIADTILRRIRPLRPKGHVVALHNNTDGALSILTYVGSPDAADVHVVPTTDPDDFLLVTRREDFLHFKRLGYNVVLQHPKVRDDGSLSVLCQRLGIPYINIEAQHGRQQMQQRMIRDVYALITGALP